MSVPYQRIAVLADPPIDGPAVAVASRAAARIGALELVCVSPNRTVAPIHRAQLERLAAGHGWTPASCTVLVGDASTMLRRR